MPQGKIHRVGHACSYTPTALIHAAGFTPYRVLPVGDSPDRAGQLLHDNLCPHAKRILDRAMDEDLPDLDGMVFMNCCDAMRRLSDAWRTVRPKQGVVLVDLPVSPTDTSVSFFAGELTRLAQTLQEWSGQSFTSADISSSIDAMNEMAELLKEISKRARKGTLVGGSSRLQGLFNRGATEPLGQTMELLRSAVGAAERRPTAQNGVPVYLFGNVLPEPEAFAHFESCGVHIAGDSVCTGLRAFNRIGGGNSEDVFWRLARGLLDGPRCPRTFHPSQPGKIAEEVLAEAQACQAKGVIGYTMKFCDPYMSRLPGIRDALREAGLPLLLLDGDCTLRSIGQQRTRIEAFAEMLR
ncbi:MAG: 2-hydroxyacyl-CoA dehydratase [Desulfomonile tiedjei]|uniref:2-hydroxyacyl-CoA dehydratase n=1 Tax=Desulfomonile tiedjei TaxID=2358 RepID=A0A9D6UZI7_9BACT|nr:2-hydroxyacyl-CoA dehydratase [Desulfomonile tiedjei]